MSSPSSRTVDRVCEMPDEDFRNLMEELTFAKPQGALARELCADASKDDMPPDVLSSLSHSASSSSTAWKSNHRNHSAAASGGRAAADGRKNSSNHRIRRSDQTGHVSGTQSLSHEQHEQQNGMNSQSLQDLVSIDCKSSGSKSGRKMNESSRANSFTEDSGGQNRTSASRAASASTMTTMAGSKMMRVKSAAVPSGISSNYNNISSKKAHHPCNKILSSSSAPISCTSTSSSSPFSMPSACTVNASTTPSDPHQDLPHHLIPKDGSNHRANSSNNNNVNKNECDVESGRSDASSQLFTPRTYSKNNHSSNHNYNNSSSISRSQPSAGTHPVHVCREENFVEELENAVELQDLRKQAEIVSIASLNGSRPAASGHDVDSVVQFSKLDSRSTIDPKYAELCHLSPNYGPSRSGGDQSHHPDRRFPGPSNDSDSALLNRSATAPANYARKTKNKKNREEPVLAGNLPGNIGDKDVDYLTHYVIGQDARMSTTSATVSRRDRKVADRSKDKKKAPERSNSQPESSSSEEKVVDHMPKGRSTSPLDRPSSPSHATSVASYAPDEFILQDEFSDDEKGYHTDQDHAGFQLMIGKKRYNRHNRMSRLPVNRQPVQSPATTAASRPNVTATATPSSPTASSSPSYSTAAFSVSGASASASGSVNLTSRGYESEKEFDNYSSRQTTIRRRKTASSMPHSERNSPENSDVDSSLSLPIVHRLPPPAPPPVIEDDRSGRISYAQIARSASAASTTASAPPLLPQPQTQPLSSRSPANNNTTNNSVGKQPVTVSANTCADVAIRAQVKSHVSQKSHVAIENSPPKDNNPGHEGHELKTKSSAMTAVTTASETSSKSDSPANATLNQSGLSETVIEVRPKSRLVQKTTTAATTASGDSRQQIRKHNSIPEASFKSMITTKTLNRSLDSARPPPELPAVIMCDDSLTSGEQRISNDLSSTAATVTFGFFDDLLPAHDNAVSLSEANQNRDQNHNHAPSPNQDAVTVDQDMAADVVTVTEEKRTPQVIAKNQMVERSDAKLSHLSEKRAPASSISYPSVSDIDIETFNYNEILTYISRAWERVIRTDRTVYARSFSSGSVTAVPEKTESRA